MHQVVAVVGMRLVVSLAFCSLLLLYTSSHFPVAILAAGSILVSTLAPASQEVCHTLMVRVAI